MGEGFDREKEEEPLLKTPFCNPNPLLLSCVRSKNPLLQVQPKAVHLRCQLREISLREIPRVLAVWALQQTSVMSERWKPPAPASGMFSIKAPPTKERCHCHGGHPMDGGLYAWPDRCRCCSTLHTHKHTSRRYKSHRRRRRWRPFCQAKLSQQVGIQKL